MLSPYPNWDDDTVSERGNLNDLRKMFSIFRMDVDQFGGAPGIVELGSVIEKPVQSVIPDWPPQDDVVVIDFFIHVDQFS